jgi:hypothetical protein
MKLRLVAVGILAALLSACATLPKLDAARDVHQFLVAVRDGDQAAFDAHVDRPALKLQMRSRALAEAPALLGRQNLGALGALLAGPIVDVAVDALVQPEVFRAVAVRMGYSPDRPIPNSLVIARTLKSLADDRVCAPEKDHCSLVFQRSPDGVWRLTAYEGDLSGLSSRLTRDR